MRGRIFVAAAVACAALLTTTAAKAQTDFFNSLGKLSEGTQIAAERQTLSEKGFTFALVYTSAVLGNLSGGINRIALYEGKVEASVTLDFEKLSQLKGLSFYANIFQLHHTRGMRDDNFNGLVTISNIEAIPATRFQEYWLEQKFFDNRFSIRLGQLAADSEFFISDYSLPLVTSDWPAITTANLPSGGPAYPLSAPGIRFRFDPTPQWTALFAIFNGDPGEQGAVNRTGTNFPLSDPPLMMAEVQRRYNQEKDTSGLAGILRAGGWYYFGDFADRRFDTSGRSLADPLSNGMPRQMRSTSGIYGIVDQQIYRPKGGSHDSGVALFSRVSVSPSDRSVVDLYVDGGIVFTRPHASRPKDKISLGFIYAKFSDPVRAADRDAIAFSGVTRPVRDYEMILEANYLYIVRNGWALQPLVQYLIHPGGSVPNPNNPSQRIKDGAIVGVRSTLHF